MSSLDDFIAAPRLCEIDTVQIGVPAVQAMRRARQFDLARVPVAHALFSLRTLPERIVRRGRAEPLDLRLDHIGRGDTGFQVLADEPERLIVGAIGRFWQPAMSFARVPSGEFGRHAEAGWGKLAWELRCEDEPPGARLMFELRLTATDDASWRKLRRYIRLIGPFSRFFRRQALALIARDLGAPHAQNTWRDVGEGVIGAGGIVVNLATPFLRGRRSHWGLTRAEAEQTQVGDELVPEPRWQWTHAIDVVASPDAVWPWVAQLGRDKGGFYSYQFLENLVGSDIQNASRVHAEWQSPRVGDALRLHPNMPPLTVAVVEPERALVAHAGADPSTGRAPARAAGEPSQVAVSWAFLLQPRADGGTRVVSRFRSDYSGGFATRVAYGPYLTESIGSVMDRRMLRGIKQRAERTPARSNGKEIREQANSVP